MLLPGQLAPPTHVRVRVLVPPLHDLLHELHCPQRLQLGGVAESGEGKQCLVDKEQSMAATGRGSEQVM